MEGPGGSVQKPIDRRHLPSSLDIFIFIATNTTLATVEQARFSACVAGLHQSRTAFPV
jgi:hypothetical protein